VEKIRIHQIVGDTDLREITTTPTDIGDNENDQVHSWICSKPEIIEDGLTIIGRRVYCDPKEIDVLAVDKNKCLVIIEAKRGVAPRDVIGQVIDYASRVSEWETSKIQSVYFEYCRKITLQPTLNEGFFEEIDGIRILVVCFSVDHDVKRMVEWLSSNYGINISLTVFGFGAIESSGGNKIRILTNLVVQEVQQARRPPTRDEFRLSLLRAIDDEAKSSNGWLTSFPGVQGSIYRRALTSDKMSADLYFYDRIPILAFGIETKFGEDEEEDIDEIKTIDDSHIGFRLTDYSGTNAPDIAKRIKKLMTIANEHTYNRNDY
jgi:hypothetical protein